MSEADTHLPEFWLSLSVAVTLLLPHVNELITLWATLFGLAVQRTGAALHLN